MALAIWLVAAALYLAFRLWYDTWRGPLRADEVDAYLAKARALGAEAHNDLSILERFLRADDGREFFMLNLVRVAPGAPPHPVTGVPTPGRDLLTTYTRAFMRRLLARGGHPALAARPIGSYVDAWHVPPDPGWTLVGYMRYRSRRDLAELAFDPTFSDLHRFKIAGTAETFSFPTQPMIQLVLGPRLWVALVLGLAAALVHLAYLLGQTP